jgi:hypothetical protein
MKIIGFDFTKMLAEKTGKSFSNLKIGNQINIKDIIELKEEVIKNKESVLDVSFIYDVIYEEDVGKISFEGRMLVVVDLKDAKEILKEWKDKKLQELFRIPLFNAILRKVGLKALQLEEELNLPPHFNLPFLDPKNEIHKK